MRIQRAILYFIYALSALSVWDITAFTYNLIPGYLWSALFICSITACIYFSSKFINDFTFENNYFKVVFCVFAIYQLVILVRGIPHNYEEAKTVLQNGTIFWSLIIPIFIFFDKKVDNVVSFMKGMYYLTIVFLIFSIIKPSLIANRVTAENFIHPFAFGAGFLLMNARYLSKKKAFICLLATTLAIISVTYLARRNAILTFGGFMVAAVFFYIKDASLSIAIKFFPVAAAGIILVIFLSDKLPAELTSRLTQRATEDTRSDLFDAFHKDMRENMVFGKGMNGYYYFPISGEVQEDGTAFEAVDYRNVIENGYLQLILKGGYIQVVLFILILLPAGYLGLIRSSNNLSRSCGMLILLWLIDMSVFGLPNLGLQYIFVWICVGLCYSPQFRAISEEEVQEAFQILN